MFGKWRLQRRWWFPVSTWCCKKSDQEGGGDDCKSQPYSFQSWTDASSWNHPLGGDECWEHPDSTLGCGKRTTLEEMKSRLERMVAFNRKELKPQAMLKAEEERNKRLSAHKAKIKSYEKQSRFKTPCCLAQEIENTSRKISLNQWKLQRINTLITREERYPSPNLPFV